MKLLIKNMVSGGCMLAVNTILSDCKVNYDEIKMGEVSLRERLSDKQYEQIRSGLQAIGLGLITDKRSVLIEKIRSSILELVYSSEEPLVKKYSCLLSEKLKYDYTYLSNVFKEAKGICIQNYIIAHKIERVKQLLAYSNLNLTEISYRMNYSSVGHLANQFKKVTGITARNFKQLQNKEFIPLEVL